MAVVILSEQTSASDSWLDQGVLLALTQIALVEIAHCIC
jgi:hypothetical protein